jgi:DNA processing protein
MTEPTEEQVAFLALCTMRGIGHATLARMAKAGASFAAFLDNSSGKEASHALQKFGPFHESEATSDWQVVRPRAISEGHRLMESLNATGTRLVFSGANEFPLSLNELSNSPAWIFVRGDASLLSRPSAAIVGARKLTEDGKWLCKFVGLCLNSWQVPVVTGLVSEVDFGVHELALRAAVPTIAVLGAGVLSESRSAFREHIIGEGGAIVTDYLPYDGYSPENFERLGRIQAALSRVLIPIEWRGKSNGDRAVHHAGILNRPIAALRLPDSPIDNLGPSREVLDTTEIFTIPGQEEEFRLFVRRNIRATHPLRLPEASRKAGVELRDQQHGPPRLRLGRGRPPRSHLPIAK